MRSLAERLSGPHQRLRVVVLILVFLLFVINAAGLTDIRLTLDGNIALNDHLWSDLLHGRLINPFQRVDFVVFIAITAALALLLPLLSPIAASMLTLACMVVPFYVAWALPASIGLVPLEYSLLSILILFSVNVLYGYFIETQQRQKIVTAFSQYVPPLVVDQISRQPGAFTMAGEAREMSVLFCDIKEFSSISEQLEPAELATMLNTYLTAMTDVLHAHGATIDKYIGDAIMAFWGAPLHQPDHAERAVNAALAMHRSLITLQHEFAARGWPALGAGIGVSSGVVSVGNMGSRYRIAYTVLGDPVNLASRLESLTRLYGVDVLVSESTRSAAAQHNYREIDHVRVRGKGVATRIYQPLATNSDALERLPQEQRALHAYYAGEWTTARQAFNELLQTASARSWYQVLLNRMAEHDCPADWDGVVSFYGELKESIDSAKTARDQ